MDKDVLVKVDGLSKTFQLPEEKRTSVKSVFVDMFRKQKYEKQTVLNDISFEVRKGEFFGIVGRNGSGKSTLLKLLAGIYYPSTGGIKVNGSLVPFIELGVGFNPELTGRENVFLNGALLGFSRKQMDVMYKDIVDFAELEKFMNQKLKNYSSGMQVRLAFSIAIRARGDILLLDEVLAVGDSAFQQKCFDYFNSLKRDKKTIILVSHNMQAVEQFCDRAMLIEKGVIKMVGSSSQIASMYENMFLQEEALARDRSRKEATKRAKEDATDIEVVSSRILQYGKVSKKLSCDDPFDVEVTVKSKIDIPIANIGINIKNRDRLMVISYDTQFGSGDVHLKKNKKVTVKFTIQNVLTNGLYSLSIGVAEHSGAVPKVILRSEGVSEFIVEGRKHHIKSLVHPSINVDVS